MSEQEDEHGPDLTLTVADEGIGLLGEGGVVLVDGRLIEPGRNRPLVVGEDERCDGDRHRQHDLRPAAGAGGFDGLRGFRVGHEALLGL